MVKGENCNLFAVTYGQSSAMPVEIGGIVVGCVTLAPAALILSTQWPDDTKEYFLHSIACNYTSRDNTQGDGSRINRSGSVVLPAPTYSAEPSRRHRSTFPFSKSLLIGWAET